MKPDDANIRWSKPPRLGMLGKSYLLLFLQGMTTALRHLLLHRKITLQSPEARHAVLDPLRYRGVHRLNRDAEGRVKCVACFLCATACPAHCIDIVAAESPWPDRQKYPQLFNIDELRCIYCGMCEEACPVEAIELTSRYDLTGESREEMIFDKEKLLGVYDQTCQAEPMPSKRMGGLSQFPSALAKPVAPSAATGDCPNFGHPKGRAKMGLSPLAAKGERHD